MIRSMKKTKGIIINPVFEGVEEKQEPEEEETYTIEDDGVVVELEKFTGTFTSITARNAMVCSVAYAEEMKERYRREVEEPEDNLDMILRYCGPWSAAFFREEKRKVSELVYDVRLQDGDITVKASYPLTVLFANEPVDFSDTPVYEGFETVMPLLITRGCFPGKKQDQDSQSTMWKLRYITGEILQIKRELSEKPDYVDRYSMDEFDDAVWNDFIDNRPPYSYGPSCPDRLLSYHLNRHVLLHMLKDFDAICRSQGIRAPYQGLFVAALVAAWYEELVLQSGIMKAQTIRVPFDALTRRAGMLCGSTENDPEQMERNKAFRKEVSEALEIVLREMDHVVRVSIPQPEFDSMRGYEECRLWALEHKDRALSWFETPQEVYKGCKVDCVININSASEEEEEYEEDEYVRKLLAELRDGEDSYWEEVEEMDDWEEED